MSGVSVLKDRRHPAAAIVLSWAQSSWTASAVDLVSLPQHRWKIKEDLQHAPADKAEWAEHVLKRCPTTEFVQSVMNLSVHMLRVIMGAAASMAAHRRKNRRHLTSFTSYARKNVMPRADRTLEGTSFKCSYTLLRAHLQLPKLFL